MYLTSIAVLPLLLNKYYGGLFWLDEVGVTAWVILPLVSVIAIANTFKVKGVTHG